MSIYLFNEVKLSIEITDLFLKMGFQLNLKLKKIAATNFV